MVAGQHGPGAGGEERVSLGLGDGALDGRPGGDRPPGGQHRPQAGQVTGPEVVEGYLLQVRSGQVVVGGPARRAKVEPARRLAPRRVGVDGPAIDAAYPVVGDPADPQVGPPPVAGEPPGQGVAVGAAVKCCGVGGRHHQERVGHAGPQPSGHHLAVDGSLVGGDVASHAAAVDGRPDQLVDQVHGVRLIEAPVGEDRGGQLVVGVGLVPALGGQPAGRQMAGQLGSREGAHGRRGVSGSHHRVTLQANERQPEVVLVGLQPVGEAEAVLDGYHQGTTGPHKVGQVPQKGIGVVAGVLQHPDAQHHVEPVVVDQVSS